MQCVNLTKCDSPYKVCYDDYAKRKTIKRLREERKLLKRSYLTGIGATKSSARASGKPVVTKLFPDDMTREQYKRRKKFLVREEQRVSKPNPKGYDTIEYLVGCGKCETCEREKHNSKTWKWSNRVANMIDYHRDNDIRIWRKGQPYDYPSGETFFVSLTFANEYYPGAGWCRNLSNSQIRYLNNDRRFLGKIGKRRKKNIYGIG